MTPNPSIRLGSVMQTLEQVVFPAVDPSNSLAVEQCGVIAAQLKMFLRHLPVIAVYHSLCRDDLVATVNNLPVAAGGALTKAAATNLQCCLKDAASDTDAAAAFHHLGFALEDLLRAAARDGAPDYRAAMNEDVFRFAKRQKDRERIWFKDAGFDPRPEELPDLETMLAGN
jgi:hypothetical protein